LIAEGSGEIKSLRTGADMDSFWWTSLAVGGLLSIPLSILANLITPRVSRYLESWNGRLKEGNRKKAIAAYQRRKLLLASPIKRDMHFASLNATMIMGLFLAAFLLFGAMYLQSTGQSPVERNVSSWAALLVAAIIFYVAQLSFSIVSEDAKALGDFAAYEKTLVERFGPDSVKDPPPSVFD